MGGVQCVGPVSVLHLRGGYGLLPSAAIGLAGELEGPQGHRDRDLVGDELGHERVHHCFGLLRLGQARRGVAQDFVFLLKQTDPAARSAEFSSLGGMRRVAGLISASRIQFVRQDSLMPKSLAIWANRVPGPRFWATRTTASRTSLG